MIKKSLKIDLPAVPNNIQLIGLYAATTPIVQAWELTKLTDLDFSLLSQPFSVQLKNGSISQHDIFYSQTQDHFETWLISNKGTNAYLLPLKPYPSTLLIFKGEQDTQDMDIVTDFLRTSPVFQWFNTVEQVQVLKLYWLSYIEIYQHSMDFD